jgi:hypothetical protein
MDSNTIHGPMAQIGDVAPWDSSVYQLVTRISVDSNTIHGPMAQIGDVAPWDSSVYQLVTRISVDPKIQLT